MRHWHRLPGKVMVESLSLKGFKSCGDVALRNVGSGNGWWLSSMILEVFSNLTDLVIQRLINLYALLGHCSRLLLSACFFAGAQKVITDLTAPSERAAALGKLGLCFGVGIIIGSALGGVISTKFG